MKKILSFMLAAFLVLSVVPAAAFAASTDKTAAAATSEGTVTITMNKNGKQEASMCDVMFAEKAELKVNGDTATMTMYVAYPVPSFPNLGTDGTIKNFTITYNGNNYVAKSDIATKPMMTVKTNSPGFGLKEGEKIQAQVLTVELPRAALDEKFLDVKAFVNVFMNMDVDFDMYLTNLVLEEKPAPQLEDGNYYVDTALWHEYDDRPSMGDSAFQNNRKALVTIKDGKVTDVQMCSDPVRMPPFVSAIVTMKVDGKDVNVLKSGKLTTEPAGNEIDYIKAFSFRLPESAQPEGMTGVTYAPVQFMAPDTPMGDNMMSARIKLDWGTATKTSDQEIQIPEDPVQPFPAVDLEDKETGIKIHADKGVFNENVTLVVKPIVTGEEAYENAAQVLNEVGRKFKLYDIYFVNESGEQVQPNGKVTVSYPVPEGYNAEELAVYRINEDGSKTLVNGTMENGSFVTVQKSFGVHGLIVKGSTITDAENGEDLNPPTGDNVPVAALAALTLVSGTAVAALVIGKKRAI